MIGSWRNSPPSRDRQPEPPKPDPHIWDQVTVEQNEQLAKSAESTKTLLGSMIDNMPPDQQSTFKNYQKTREASGNQDRKPK